MREIRQLALHCGPMTTKTERKSSIVVPLQKRILNATEREQARIAQELHDGLGQHLTGIAFLAKALARKLADKGAPESSDAEQLAQLVNHSVSMTRSLAYGLKPVGHEDNSLMSALRQLAQDVSSIYRVDCRFVNDEPVLIRSQYVAHHLYRIAQEAVNNALKHGGPKQVLIELDCKAHRSGHETVELSISNDGKPFPQQIPTPDAAKGGMGLAGMRYRVKLIKGRLFMRREPRPMVMIKAVVDNELAQTLKEPTEL